jgi:hypothetical protein
LSDARTHSIRLQEFPVELFFESRCHNEALLREFMFISATDVTEADVPTRLLTLGRQLRDRFFGLNATLEEQLDAARARGDDVVDLEVRVAAAGREAAITLGALFDEADAYCRSGDLLTLAESEDVRDFRTWYIEEVVRQLDGGPPTAWTDWRARRPTPR